MVALKQNHIPEARTKTLV